MTTPPTPVVPTPTQVTHPLNATLRTIVSAVITIATIIPWVVDAIDSRVASGPIVAAGAQALVVVGIITRLMAFPVVNAWLTKIGLGAAPKADPPVVIPLQDETTGKPVGAADLTPSVLTPGKQIVTPANMHTEAVNPAGGVDVPLPDPPQVP